MPPFAAETTQSLWVLLHHVCLVHKSWEHIVQESLNRPQTRTLLEGEERGREQGGRRRREEGFPWLLINHSFTLATDFQALGIRML